MFVPGDLSQYVLAWEWDWPIPVLLTWTDPFSARAISFGEGKKEPSRIWLYGRERRALKRTLRAHKAEQRAVLRASIILSAATGANNTEIARELKCDIQTVRKWRERFAKSRLKGLLDAPRPGRPPIYTSEIKHKAFALVVSDPPAPHARWTIDLLLDEMNRRGIVTSLSRETLSHWLRTATIKPHRSKYWLNSKDPDFHSKMNRIVDLYINPPTDGQVVCVDEVTGLQALERKYPTLPTRPGKVRRVEFEYKRHGTVKMIASFGVHSGQVSADFVECNNSDAFIAFLEQLKHAYPDGKIYLVLDNGSSHISKQTRAYFKENPRFVPAYTPTHASWLNQIEIWFSALKRKALKNVSFTSKDALKSRILSYVAYHNRVLARPYKWTYKGQPATA